MIFGLPLLVEKVEDWLWPCRKYRNNTAVASRIKLYNIITRIYAIFLIICGIFGAMISILPVKSRIIILSVGIILLCICLLILQNKKPMQNPHKFWLDWWQGKSPWYKIITS